MSGKSGFPRRALYVAAYNRPEFFTQTLSSLAANPGVDKYDFWLFLDGPRCPEDVPRQEQIKKTFGEFAHPNKYLVSRSSNIGCGLNMVRLKMQLFDEECYDQVVALGEDYVLAPYALMALEALHLRVCEVYGCGLTGLHSWCRQAPTDDIERREWKRKNLHVTQNGCPPAGAVTDLFSIYDYAVWAAIRPLYMRYAEKFLEPLERQGLPYSRRHHDDIRRWYDSVLPGVSHASAPSSQDGAIALAVNVLGIPAYVPVVNHALYVGEHGEHTNRQVFESLGAHLMHLDDLPVSEVLTALRRADVQRL